ncbi:hypothetical protein ABPG75_004684 [Micractinium tetrahymenae]
MQRMRGLLRSARGGGSTQAEPDEAAGVEELASMVAPDTIAAFAGSSELPSGPEAADEARQLLGRYWRAEKGSAAKAAKRLQEQAAWHRGFGVVTEEAIAAELASSKVKLQPPAAGSSGRPLLIVKARLHKPGATPQAINQFICYCLEAACHYCWNADNPDGKMVALFDLGGLRVKNLDATALRASFTMLAQHFPERMLGVWMLDAPTIFWGLWKLVEPFVDATARKNIHFVNGKAGRAALVESLGPSVVPLEYGGSTAEVPIELAAQQLDSWRRRQQQQEQVLQSAQQQQQQQADEQQAEEQPGTVADGVEAGTAHKGQPRQHGLLPAHAEALERHSLRAACSSPSRAQAGEPS